MILFNSKSSSCKFIAYNAVTTVLNAVKKSLKTHFCVSNDRGFLEILNFLLSYQYVDIKMLTSTLHKLSLVASFDFPSW